MTRSLPTLLITLLLAGPALAQQPSPLSTPNPAAPTLNAFSPAGMQRGTTLELNLTGTNLADPVVFRTSFPAKVTIPTDNNNGKDPAKLRVALELPADAPLGLHTVRLMTGRGLSNFRTFCIDDLPQVVEVDNNKSKLPVLEANSDKVKSAPQAITPPCVVGGRADPEASDYFKFTAKAGQRLSFDLLGRRLGSTFDPQLTLFDAKTGRELTGGLSLDSPGCQTDPRFTYTFKADGEYVIEVRDTIWRGGPDYMYRLRVGDFPCATAPVPMAVKRGTKASVGFAGPLVEGVAPVEVEAPADPTVDTVWVTPRGTSGLSGWPVALDVSEVDEVMEQEPNNDPAKAQKLTVPCGVTGRFLDKGDSDHYTFPMTKGQRLIIEARAHELGSPTEVFMNLKDAKGAQVAAINPMQNARIDYTAQADGDMTLSLEHLHYWGGPSESYHIRIVPYQPGFSLGLFLDRYDVPLGAPLSIPVFLAARRDYTGPIELTVLGPKGITGSATIAANAPAAPAPPAPPPAAASIPLTVAPDVAPGPYNLVIQGKAHINGKDVIEYASLRTVISQAMGGLPYPPRNLLNTVSLAVTEKPPFLLTAKFDAADVLRGGTATLTVTAAKNQGFDEEIALTLGGVPANVAPPKAVNIAKGQTEAKLELKPAAAAAVGSFPITVTGKAKFQNKEFSVNSTPAALVVALPFALKVDPLPVKVAPGDKVMVKVTADRKGGYKGPITLEFRNLPAGVTAAKAEIAMDQTAVDVELSAAANAAVGDKGDVNILGTATAAANQQNPTPNFMVSVIKK